MKERGRGARARGPPLSMVLHVHEKLHETAAGHWQLSQTHRRHGWPLGRF